MILLLNIISVLLLYTYNEYKQMIDEYVVKIEGNFSSMYVIIPRYVIIYAHKIQATKTNLRYTYIYIRSRST